MATKAELTTALEKMLAAFGPGSFVMEKGDALRQARIALGRAFPWELRKQRPATASAEPRGGDAERGGVT